MISAIGRMHTMPPPVPERNRSVEETTRRFIESQRLHSSEEHPTASSNQRQHTRIQRKSVSFDLTDNEYIPVFESSPQPSESSASENLADLYLSQFSPESGAEFANDGYEVPIKYHMSGRRKSPSPSPSSSSHPVKSILRSPSPNANILLSSDRPLRLSRDTPPPIPGPKSQLVTAALIHASDDDEIERENPFRQEFIAPPYENVYEELHFSDPSRPVSSESDDAMSGYARPMKIRPKSEAVETHEYTEVPPKASQSIDNLQQTTKIEANVPASKSTGNLADRPKHKPPLPPKPKTVKHAEIFQNEALKSLQMDSGKIYEYLHNANTNEIVKLKPSLTLSNAIERESQFDAIETASSKSPTPERALVSSVERVTPEHDVPKQTKVYRRTFSGERPPTSPPPPPINFATLPTIDKTLKLQTDSGPILEILTANTCVKSDVDLLPKRRDVYHENSPEYSLVTEDTHREILLHENELRKQIQQEQQSVDSVASSSASTRIPVRRAPDVPTQPAAKYELHQLHSPQPVTQIFPQTQILPVQYSQLPTPQQPGYFHAFPPAQVCCSVSHPTTNYLIPSPFVANLSPLPHYHHYHTFHSQPDSQPSTSFTYYQPQSNPFVVDRSVINDEHRNRFVTIDASTETSSIDSFEPATKTISPLQRDDYLSVTPATNDQITESSSLLSRSIDNYRRYDDSIDVETMVIETTEIENVTEKTVLTTFGKTTSV